MSAGAVQHRQRASGHAVARRTEPTFASLAGQDGVHVPRVLHPGSVPARMSLWLRPSAGAR